MWRGSVVRKRELLLRQRIGAAFRCGGEVDRGQESTHQQHQQIDLHVFLRRFVPTYYKSEVQNAFYTSDDSRVIKVRLTLRK